MKYDDIIGLPHYEPKHHRRQDRLNRAKIFAPFQALKGYEESIEERKLIRVAHSDMTENMLEELNNTLNTLMDMLARDEHPIIRVIYKNPATDEYISFEGKLARITVTSQTIQVVDRKILFENLRSIGFD
ncbi:MAG: hypothetical protein K6F92_01255 [Lachnospiraceae bacterium]|nr:hypothetical protein [Lachnospiraceae bacterium]